MKPTDIDPLWVHITCAWFQPEVCFASDEKMEPAVGILRIPSNSFVKVEFSFACVNINIYGSMRLKLDLNPPCIHLRIIYLLL